MIESQLKSLLFKYQNNLTRQTLLENLPVGEKIKKCLLSGLYNNVAFLSQKKTYKTFQEDKVCLVDPESTIQGQPNFLVYLELQTSQNNVLRTVTEVEGEWLRREFPSIYESEREGEGREGKMAAEKIKMIKSN